MKRFGLLSTLIIVVQQIIYCQGTLPSLDYIPQSPIASSYSRYGEIPVDNSTGVSRIEVPIYNMKVGDVSVPITISYHASGIKVRDVASEVGLGWVLNTGGIITANIIGKPDVDDLNPTGFLSSSDIYNSISDAYATNTSDDLAWWYWNNLTNNADLIDYYSDRYSYSLCTGESGVFRRDFISDSIKYMPYRPIKVSFEDNMYIKIISSNGYKQYFREMSSSHDCYALSKVVSNNNVDSILYYYSPNESVMSMNVQYNVAWQFEQLVPTEYCTLESESYIYSRLYGTGGLDYYQTPLIDSILTKKEIILFQYIKDRQDANNHQYRLVKILIKDSQSRQNIKVFDLYNNSYFGTQSAGNRRLKLDSISVSGSTTDIVERFSFLYNSTPLPPYPSLQNEYYYEDYWGYYNGTQTNTLLPYFFNNFNIPGYYTYADRNPNFNYAKSCILTEIKYPTRGTTSFEYEPNYIDENYNYVGGLRIKKITSYTDGSSPAFVKSYIYGGGNARNIEQNNFKYEQENWIVYQCKNENGVPMGGPYPASYNSNVGVSNSLRPITVGNGTPIIYSSVTEYFGDEASNIGKIEYGYNYSDCEYRNEMPGSIDTRFFSYFHSDCGNYIPELTGKSIYKFENGNYILVKAEENTYEKFKVQEFNTGINFASKITLTNYLCDPTQAINEYHRLYDYLNTLVYSDTKGYQEVSLLSQTDIYDYATESTFVRTTKTFDYDADHTLLRTSTTTGSDGINIIESYKYPFDENASPYTDMVSRNIISPVIEQNTFKGTTQNLLQQTKTNYIQLYSYLFVPSTIQVKNGAGPLETRLSYYAYDLFGNLLDAGKDSDIRVSYIWGYKSTLPVAKIENATLQQVQTALGGSIPDLGNGGLSDAQNNSLRSGLPAAMISTFAYNPLVGMTSQTDPNGVTTYYEYDTFGRLKLIKDDDGHILKTYEYHYKQ